MNTIHDFVRVHLPNYFRSIPVPKDVSGLTNLSGSECLRLMAFFLLVFMILYSLIRTIFFSSASSSKQPPKTLEKLDDRVVNLTILKEKEKVATAKDIEDLDEKQAFCRCWRSAKVRQSFLQTCDCVTREICIL